MSWQNYSNEEFNRYLDSVQEVGFVEMVSHPIAYINGLPGAKPSEVVIFENGEMGFVQALTTEYVEVLVLSKLPVKVNTQVARTGNVLNVPVGNNLLGHTVDALGRPIYKNKIIRDLNDYRPIEQPPLGIAYRKKIERPLETGVTVVDLMLPLGKGQRELVLGDRKIGKTQFLQQTMLTQIKQGSVCIYAAIGKKKIDIRKVENFAQKNNVSDKLVIVASSSSDALGMVYITPYAAMTMAEYYRDIGVDVLVVLDDLSTHGKFYREIALLSRRFPGRNSYPSDIFYTHARLLERGGNFVHQEKGEVAITCLPVAETQEGDISGYIQTNLMGITDGHIFFDRDIFDKGRRPAVNYFLSVTRVGRQTQSRVRWGINRELTSFLTLLEKTQGFVHFGAELNEGIKTTLSTGDKILSFFSQHMNKIVDMNLQILLFCLIWIGTWPGEGKSKMKSDIETISRQYETNESFRKEMDDMINNAKDFNTLLGIMTQTSAEILQKANVKQA